MASFQKTGGRQERYLDVNSTQAATEISAGRSQTSPENLTVAAHSRRMVWIGAGNRGMQAQFIGVGANDQTEIWNVYSFRVGLSGRTARDWNLAASKGDLELRYEGKVTATLSTAVGAGTNTPVLATERIADTIVWEPSSASTSPKGPRALLEASNGLGTSYAHSPADNTPAFLSIPDLDGADGFIMERIGGTATDGNAVVEPTP